MLCMFNFNSEFTPTPTQIIIVELLAQKRYQQKDLGKEVGIAPSTLKYNLDVLESILLQKILINYGPNIIINL